MMLDMEKLTAYVLDELDETERQAVEAALKEDESARQTVTELVIAAEFAREALRAEREPALAPEQRERIEDKAARSKEPLHLHGRSHVRRWGRVVVAVAATVVIFAGANLYLLLTSTRSAPPSQYLAGVGDEAPGVQLRKLNERDGLLEAAAETDAAPADSKDKALTEAADVAAGPQQLPSSLNNAIVGGRLEVRPKLGQSESAKAEPAKTSQDYFYYDINGDGLNENVPSYSTTDWSYVDDPSKNYWPGHNTEAYSELPENPFFRVTQTPLSTFSIDVDTASYSNVRRFLTENALPPPDAVRIEEMVNYFDYNYAPPSDKSRPFAAHVEVAACPWAPQHRLARIGLKGWEIAAPERPASNLVFLIDVSGSMQPDNKLPLLKQALQMLVRRLDERDRIAMVVYASSSGLVLPSTSGHDQETILDAIGRLESGGSTYGSAGIQLAYETAVANFMPGAVNRVILCTDGDFNVGTTSEGELTTLIEEKAKSGVFLTVLGFGMGNLKDSTLEKLADKGNGNYGYIDTLNEAQKLLVDQMTGTLVTIAKDVKIQVEFNPVQVEAYRLIGYENRIMRDQDFNDDTKDAGEIGAGHTVTALYELVPAGAPVDVPKVDPLKYQQPATEPSAQAQSGDLFTLKLRYKAPDSDTSELLEFPVKDEDKSIQQATKDFRFAAAVAGFGLLLRNSEHKGTTTYDTVLSEAETGIGQDRYGYRSEFLQLVRWAKELAQRSEASAESDSSRSNPIETVAGTPE